MTKFVKKKEKKKERVVSPWIVSRELLKDVLMLFLKLGRPQTGQVRVNRLGISAPANDSSLNINSVLYNYNIPLRVCKDSGGGDSVAVL
jgi:hypothetical protein